MGQRRFSLYHIRAFQIKAWFDGVREGCCWLWVISWEIQCGDWSLERHNEGRLSAPSSRMEQEEQDMELSFSWKRMNCEILVRWGVASASLRLSLILSNRVGQMWRIGAQCRQLGPLKHGPGGSGCRWKLPIAQPSDTVRRILQVLFFRALLNSQHLQPFSILESIVVMNYIRPSRARNH